MCRILSQRVVPMGLVIGLVLVFGRVEAGDLPAVISGQVSLSKHEKQFVVVDRTVTIKAGASLTLGPGVKLTIEKQASIVVEGQLTLDGNPLALEQWVVVKGYSDSQAPGILLRDNGSAVITGALFRGFYTAIAHEGGGKLIIEKSLFAENESALLLGGQAAVRLAGTRIAGGDLAIELESHRGDLELVETQIKNNRIGIRVFGGSGTIRLERCDIDGGEQGIYVSDPDELALELDRSSFRELSDYAIEVVGGAGVLKLTIRRTSFSDTGGALLSAMDNLDLLMRESTVVGGRFGVFAYPSNGRLEIARNRFIAQRWQAVVVRGNENGPRLSLCRNLVQGTLAELARDGRKSAAVEISGVGLRSTVCSNLIVGGQGDGLLVNGPGVGTLVVANNTIYGNRMRGLRVEAQGPIAPQVRLYNNLLARNKGGGILARGNHLLRYNNAWRNGSEGKNYEPATLAGETNWKKDPRFAGVDPADSASFLRLRADSPLIDRGFTVQLPEDDCRDIDGQTRPLRGGIDAPPRWDIGADEFKLSPPTVHAISPGRLFPGQQVAILLSGEGMPPEIELILDHPGITILSQQRIDDHRLEVLVEVARKAEPGPVKLRLRTLEGKRTLSGRLVVVDGPKLDSGKQQPDSMQEPRAGGSCQFSPRGAGAHYPALGILLLCLLGLAFGAVYGAKSDSVRLLNRRPGCSRHRSAPGTWLSAGSRSRFVGWW